MMNTTKLLESLGIDIYDGPDLAFNLKATAPLNSTGLDSDFAPGHDTPIPSSPNTLQISAQYSWSAPTTIKSSTSRRLPSKKKRSTRRRFNKDQI